MADFCTGCRNVWCETKSMTNTDGSIYDYTRCRGCMMDMGYCFSCGSEYCLSIIEDIEYDEWGNECTFVYCSGCLEESRTIVEHSNVSETK